MNTKNMNQAAAAMRKMSEALHGLSDETKFWLRGEYRDCRGFVRKLTTATASGGDTGR